MPSREEKKAAVFQGFREFSASTRHYPERGITPHYAELGISDVFVDVCSVHNVFLCFGLLCPFTNKARQAWAASGGCLQEEPLVPAPAPSRAVKGKDD